MLTLALQINRAVESFWAVSSDLSQKINDFSADYDDIIIFYVYTHTQLADSPFFNLGAALSSRLSLFKISLTTSKKPELSNDSIVAVRQIAKRI